MHYSVQHLLSKKIGATQVILLDLMPDNTSQGKLDSDAPETWHRGKLMAAMDAINDRFGRSTIHRGLYALIHENFRLPKTDGLLPVNPRQNSLQIDRIALASEGIVPQEMQVLPRRR